MPSPRTSDLPLVPALISRPSSLAPRLGLQYLSIGTLVLRERISVANALDTFCVMVEPQEGGTYDEIMTLSQKAEALGFEGFFRSDHYQPMNVPRESDSSDAWAV